MGDNSREIEAGFNGDSFEAWLKTRAEQKGVPESEIMNQMVSSYWILDDLIGLASESDADRAHGQSPVRPTIADPDDAPFSPPAEQMDTSEDGDESTETDDDPTDASSATETVPDGSSRPGSESSLAEFRATLQLLKELDRELSELQGDDGADGQLVEALAEEVGSLRNRADALEASVQAVASEFERVDTRLDSQDDVADELTAGLDGLDATVDDLTSELAGLRADLDALETTLEADVRPVLATLESDVAALRADVADAATKSELADVSQLLVALDEDTAEEHESMRADFQSELEHVSTILEHLLDTDDRLDAELGTLLSAYDRDVPPLLELRRESRDLADLKAKAQKLGIATASCDGCGDSVDLSLLARPRCPNCQASFGDLSPKQGLIFGSNTLETRPEPPTPSIEDVDPPE
jgi:archaellum component FlaC